MKIPKIGVILDSIKLTQGMNLTSHIQKARASIPDEAPKERRRYSVDTGLIFCNVPSGGAWEGRSSSCAFKALKGRYTKARAINGQQPILS